jgi:hypothetical protein
MYQMISASQITAINQCTSDIVPIVLSVAAHRRASTGPNHTTSMDHRQHSVSCALGQPRTPARSLGTSPWRDRRPAVGGDVGTDFVPAHASLRQDHSNWKLRRRRYPGSLCIAFRHQQMCRPPGLQWKPDKFAQYPVPVRLRGRSKPSVRISPGWSSFGPSSPDIVRTDPM